MTNAEYHSDLTHLSHSMMEMYVRDPQLFHDVVIDQTRGQDPPTDNMDLGTAVHAVILENKRIEDLFEIMYPPINPKTGREYGTDTIKYTEYISGLDEEKQYLTQQQVEAANVMVQSVRNHRLAMSLLGVGGEAEKEIRWTRDDGIKCKMKLDLEVPHEVYDVRIIVDLKTAADPTPEGFLKPLMRFGYHRQQAWYLEPFKDDPIHTEFAFVVVGSGPPYETYVHELDEEDVEMGRRENEEILRRIEESKRTGVWVRPERTIVNKLKIPRYYREIERIF